MPSPSLNFAGITSGTPPDTNGAVGPAHLLVTVNFEVAVQSKTGDLLSSVSLSGFFSRLGVSDTYDPRVIYDPHSARFIIVAGAERRAADSAVLLAVSDNSNPLLGWSMWRFDADSANALWVDFPNVGVTVDRLTFTSNMFAINGDAFQGVNVWAIDKSTALDGGAITSTLFYVQGIGSTLVPAHTFDADITAHYLINPFWSGGGILSLYMLTGSAATPEFTTSTFQPVAGTWADTLPDAPQLGTAARLQTNDARIMNAVIRNGSLWACHTAGMPAAGADRCAIQWWEIDVNQESPGFGQVIQSGIIDHSASGGLTPGMYYYYPSIAVNKFNDVLIGFSGSSPSMYVGAFYAFRNASTPAGEIEGVVRYKAGVGIYGGGRWGDYSSASVDPADDIALWTFQEYAGSGGEYGTWWARVDPDEVAGTRIQGSHVPPFIAEGISFQLTAPAGTDYAWEKDGVPIPGAAARVLGFKPLSLIDTGTYVVHYTGAQRGLLRSQPYILDVEPAASVPAPGALLAVFALLLPGAYLARRR